MKLVALFLFFSSVATANPQNLTISGYVPNRVDLVTKADGQNMKISPDLDPSLRIYSRSAKMSDQEIGARLKRQIASTTIVEPSIIVIEAP